MVIKYYYIDDDPVATIQETAKGLSTSPEILEVIPYQHEKWQEEIDFLVANQAHFDGLLLDWGLQCRNESGDEANYNVEALAQQLRRLIVEKKRIKKDFPIVLCSAQHKFNQIFTKQQLASHDLFDAIYEKDDFHEKHQETIAELVDLAKGYQLIQTGKEQKRVPNVAKTILGVTSIENIDYRLIEYFTTLISEGKPVHELARFILSKVVKPTGLLIDHYVLAARLGIDIIQGPVSEDWGSLLKKIAPLKYAGAFATAWERWWMDQLSDWWQNTFNCSIGSLSGPEKVELLNKKFKWKLNPAKKTAKSRSEYFWVVCKESHVPIAIEDAFIAVAAIDKAPWEEDEYLSIDRALEHDNSVVHILERERLIKLKRLNSRERKK